MLFRISDNPLRSRLVFKTRFCKRTALLYFMCLEKEINFSSLLGIRVIFSSTASYPENLWKNIGIDIGIL